ncbi:hypothetical protein HFP05_00465 [Rhodanobacter denitrificans]|nr:hypothetical protein [Rhodanobacter denitrificans]
MEHLLRLVDSNATLYAAAVLFTIGVILWFAWARFFHERDGLKTVPHFVIALSLLVLFIGCYASVAIDGLDGVTCAAGRYSSRVTCYSHDESPWIFWAVVGVQTYLFALLMLAALVFLVRIVVPGAPGAAAPVRHLRQANDTDTGAGPPVVRNTKQGGALRVFQFVIGGIVMATLAWIAVSLDQVNEVRRQVAEAFASVAFERGTVEAYLRDHGRLPEDNKAAALLPPAALHRRGISEVEVVKGSLLLKFDAAVDEHLAGRQVLLIAVRHDSQVHWHCATFDVDDRYLPVHCSADL